MGKFKDLVGKRYWKLLVIDISPHTDKYENIYWACLCTCGTQCTVRGSSLKNGHTTSCGCGFNDKDEINQLDLQAYLPDETGNTYRQLAVIRRASTSYPESYIHWECVCVCGNHLVARADHLRRGEITSCGCDKPVPTIRIRHIDETGNTYGKLTVIKKSEKSDASGGLYWECLCDCGNTFTARGVNLRNHQTTSCGCDSEIPYIDETGKKYGSWTVKALSAKKGKNGALYWLCICKCGTERDVLAASLRNGYSTSCGCGTKSRRPKILHNETGKRHGKLTVADRNYEKKDGKTYWNCLCDCGTSCVVRADKLRSEKTKSCGCLVTIKETGNTYGKLTVEGPDDTKTGEQYWWCRCECGNLTSKRGVDLRNGHTKSCSRSCWWSKNYLISAINEWQRATKASAERRNLEYTLSKEDFEKISQLPCAYCLTPPAIVSQTYRTKKSRLVRSSIDRIDSSKGYTPDNIQACCMNCNIAKSDLPQHEFLLWVRKTYVHSCLTYQHITPFATPLKPHQIRETIFEHAINELITRTKESARLRNLEYHLTRHDHEQIALSSCYYCGSPPSNQLRSYRTKKLRIKYSGIDRIDPSKGYVQDNIRPSCKTCNTAKADRPENEFIHHIKTIYKNNHAATREEFKEI